MPSRSRAVAVVVAAALVAAAPLASAATKKPVKKPAPGSVVKTISGSYAHGNPRITQNVWTAQNCASTLLGSYDTNNLSASVLPIAAYAGKQLSVTFTPQSTVPLPYSDNYGVVFYDKACNRLDINDGKNVGGQWAAQQSKLKQSGMIPTGATAILIQTAVNSTQYETSPEGAAWQLVVRIPKSTDGKPTPLTLTGGVPV